MDNITRHNFENGIATDVLLDEMFHKTDVQIIGSELYMPYGGWINSSIHDPKIIVSVTRQTEEGLQEFVLDGNPRYIFHIREYLMKKYDLPILPTIVLEPILLMALYELELNYEFVCEDDARIFK